MAAQIEIGGHKVAAAYVYATIVWDVFVLAMWPPAIVGLRRALKLYHKSRENRRDTLFYWAHVMAVQICITIIAIDPWGIYLHFWGSVKLFCECESNTRFESDLFLFQKELFSILFFLRSVADVSTYSCMHEIFLCQASCD